MVARREKVRAENRAAVAYIVGRLLTGKHASSVYDYARSVYVNFSGSVRTGHVQVFSYETSNYVSGSGSSSSLNLFDYAHGNHLHLKLAGNQFKGFDYGTGTHFQGNVAGRGVQLFDYGEGQYFNYAI